MINLELRAWWYLPAEVLFCDFRVWMDLGCLRWQPLAHALRDAIERDRTKIPSEDRVGGELGPCLLF